ncbi:MAG: acyl-CoA dehydrogenase family protein [Gemmatimonadetes bacterium]|nr:acyl-CoA dehydrogenase family protein [Gemmatimonadota bacterium]
MDFTLEAEIEETRRRIHAFVAEHVLPVESRAEAYDAHENIAEGVLSELRAKAKEAGLWALAMPKARGGQGFGVVGLAACYEEMNRSIFGPVVFNAAAPDDDWTDRKVWKRVNPNLGVSVNMEYLERECRKAEDTPSHENTFKRLHLNIRTRRTRPSSASPYRKLWFRKTA